MNSIVIFSNQLHLYVTLGALAFFIMCSVCVSAESKRNTSLVGIQYLIAGMVLDIISVWFDSSIDGLLASISDNVLVVFSLLIKLVILVLYTTFATTSLLGKGYAGIVSTITAIIGVSVIIWGGVISPNGAILNLLNGVFPSIGFAYLTASFFVSCFGRHVSGYVICAMVTAVLTVVSGTNISSETFLVSTMWFNGVLGYVGIGIGMLFIVINAQSNSLDQAERNISQYNQRFKEIVKLSPFPIMISKLSDDTILLANNNFFNLFGITEKDMEMYRFRDFFVDKDNRRLLNSHLEKEKIVNDFEILVKAANGETPFWLSTSANIIDYDYDIAIYAAFQDITDRKKREDLLKNQATRDPLTSLYNRRYFEDEVNRRIFNHVHDTFSVFMIDADHFKSVNDTYGHKVGDKVLVALASTAEKSLRDKDIVARYGGEEFVVYLANNDGEQAKVVADRLRESISKIVIEADNGETFGFTVSIGIASSHDSEDLGELIKMADDALYQAKETGRNRCVIYHPEIVSEAQDVKEAKQAENVHPAFAKDNNVEISLINAETEENSSEQNVDSIVQDTETQAISQETETMNVLQEDDSYTIDQLIDDQSTNPEKSGNGSHEPL